ncbi:transmembrane protein 243 isoform X1 [Sarcophilus harrisii]|uniref:Transmembrane protein 243 n=1 Tax=Sarcophilus harrisii TaxID=9305 RepID=A0A7N4P6M6_SARHA|nr:transmembrane protein 243 isoform X1 [Sarcophilus harrisii]
MEDFATRTYGTSGLDNRPLFGETSARDRVINLVVGSLTFLLLLVTLISAFVFPQLPPKPLNIFFAVCISLSCITACILVPVKSKFLLFPVWITAGVSQLVQQSEFLPQSRSWTRSFQSQILQSTHSK